MTSPLRRYRVKRGLRNPDNNLFHSYTEEKKVCRYLQNLIKSRFLHSHTEALFNLATDILGIKQITDMIKRNYPELAGKKDLMEKCAEYEFLVRHVDNIKAFLTEEVFAAASERLEELVDCHEPEIEKRFSILRKTFALTNEDIEILTFFYLIQTSEIMKDSYHDTYITDFSCVTVFRNYGDVLLGMKRDVFLNSMASGNLFKAELLKKEKRENYIEISPWCVDYLSCLRDEDLIREFSAKGNDEVLEVSDFDIHEDNLLVLDALFEGSGKQNILLYGAAGTGKTSFARSLAKRYNKVLYTVKSPDTDEHKDRLRAIFATVNLAEKDKSVILVDEADEILNSYNSIFFESKTAKSWINQFLDSHDKKIIWITNRSSGIDPSTMRRFSFSVEFKNLNKKNRIKVLKYELEKSGINDFLSDNELDDLCRTYNVDASGIVNAINILNIASDINKETALRKVRTVLKSHEKATRRICNNIKEREFASWTFEGLNTSVNLRDVVSALHLYDTRPHTKNLSIALLLYGLPGTGKSEFVYYLGNALGKEVLL